MAVESVKQQQIYGCDKLGRLKKVMLHRPGKALELINEHNYRNWLFDAVPDVENFIEEHVKYEELLKTLGIEVLQLCDHVRATRDMIEGMPNLTYLHDIAVVSCKGAMVSRMAMQGRAREHEVVREALDNLDIPILYEFDGEQDAFEGCLLLSPDSVLVADTERHKSSSIYKFIDEILNFFDNVIYVQIPKERRFMHPDTIYNRVKDDLSIVYLPAFEGSYLYTAGGVSEIDFESYINSKGIELLKVSDDEQRRLACSFVPLEPGLIIQNDYAFDSQTRRELNRKGVDIIPFKSRALISGGGSLRCLTLRLLRE